MSSATSKPVIRTHNDKILARIDAPIFKIVGALEARYGRSVDSIFVDGTKVDPAAASTIGSADLVRVSFV